MNSRDQKYSAFEILPKSRIILCHFQGPTLMEDIINLNVKFISHPNYSPDYDVIMDFRDCQALVFRVDVLEYLSFFKRTVRLQKKVKSAIILNSMNGEFLFKTYKVFISLFNIETEKFYQFDSCISWVKPNLKDYTEITDAMNKLIKQNQISLN